MSQVHLQFHHLVTVPDLACTGADLMVSDHFHHQHDQDIHLHGHSVQDEEEWHHQDHGLPSVHEDHHEVILEEDIHLHVVGVHHDQYHVHQKVNKMLKCPTKDIRKNLQK